MSPVLHEAAAALGRALTARGWRVSCAESCTGGLVAAAITSVAGSSGWFDAGFVTYSNQAKTALLGVQSATLDAHGAVSEETVAEMARGAMARSGADLAVAISGIAGPGGGTPAKPVGMVCFGVAETAGTRTTTLHFDGDRDAIREAATLHALHALTQMAMQVDRAVG